MLGGDDEAWLGQQVTVIVTTSPARSDPELDLLWTTFSSLSLAGLGSAPKVLVCDHFSVGEAVRGGEHRGVRSAEQIERYEARLRALQEADWAADVEVLRLEHWHGFALACQRGLALVRTPLVCVVQHDLAFVRPLDFRPVAEVLLSGGDAEQPVNCVSFCKPRMANYRDRTLSRFRLEIGGPVEWPSSCGRTASLSRLPQFLDCTHLARSAWYRGLFGVPLLHGEALSTGQFTEDNLGQFMLARAKLLPGVKDGAAASEGVLDMVAEWGCWLWGLALEPPIFHLDGRVFLSSEERLERGIPSKHFRYLLAEAATAAEES